MASVVFLRDTTANIANIPIVDGQVIFSTNENFIYIDNGNQRTQYRNNGTAAGVQYDNSGSTLISTTVNGAINELDAKTQTATTSRLGIVKPDGTTTSTDANGVISVINNSASNTTYNNQSSHLTATDVQAAIDELKTLLASYYTKTEMDALLAQKFDKESFELSGNILNIVLDTEEE